MENEILDLRDMYFFNSTIDRYKMIIKYAKKTVSKKKAEKTLKEFIEISKAI